MDENDIKEVYENLNSNLLNSNLMKDNKIYFKVDGESYRVVMPSQKQLTDADEYKNAFMYSLIKKKTVRQDVLIKDLKEYQDIDVEKIQDEIGRYEKDLMNKHLSLAKKKDSATTSIEKFKEEISDIYTSRMKLILEKAKWLSPCIEIQTKTAYYKFLTACCTEKEIEDEKYKKVWPTFSDYEKEDTKLGLEALGYISEIIYELEN